ncbi:protein rarD [Mycobacteroides chelonae]|jgi:chloramphenicol-sensitive protein RarD|uniref:EamA family transporter RarD n=1 Tax=Mycobacteroides chelonae TaxID=1774 RepID=UPI0008A831C0|nr:EamA family transporter RarD [Mycobacteroides chelonae]MBF9521723.1 EamA family transporter RarD [Mycobacteroides chelonae]OHU49982.1 protein rarD [Mycobacteroides chelonae]PKQ58562.1 EamA family transporter [Mycobacterium sp. MHSD3]SKL79413.1 Putative RarD protein [Mycobacteroides abscessus subsp. bolletii]
MSGIVTAPEENRLKSGYLFGAAAYFMWGLFPAFFPLLKPASALEILAHRMIWTLLLMVIVVAISGRLRDLIAMGPRNWFLLAGASALIALNWGVYIYAVNSGHVLDAALGYFVNPLVTVLLGVLIFGEPLSRWQLLALVLAVTAVVVLTINYGQLPVITLVLAVSFAGYGAIKKTVTVDPRVSLTAEGIVAAPFALAYVAFLGLAGQQHFFGYTHGHTALIVFSGAVTALPLLMFGIAAQRIPLVTLGLLQYLTPSLQMLWGVLVKHEAMPPERWAGFALIWAALVVFTVDAVLSARRVRPATT